MLAAAMLMLANPAAVFAADEPSFQYSYPKEIVVEEGLLAALEARKVKRKAEFDGYLAEGRATGSVDNYMLETDWQIKSETDRLIVMVSSNYVFAGGAHGNFWSDAILWDKVTKEQVTFLDLFSDKEAARAAILPNYCAVLDSERLALRGESTPKDDTYGQCVDPFDEGITFPDSAGSNGYTRVAFVLPPYSAGPYVEGEYAFDVPVSAALRTLVKPEYSMLFLSN
jgi:hypothetical protein